MCRTFGILATVLLLLATVLSDMLVELLEGAGNLQGGSNFRFKSCNEDIAKEILQGGSIGSRRTTINGCLAIL